MDIYQKFGSYMEKQIVKQPDQARKKLIVAYRAKQGIDRMFTDKRVPASKKYLTKLAMDTMIQVLSKPEQSAMTSLFVPSEPLAAAGITPYSPEAMSSFMTGSKIERPFLQKTSEEGMPDSMCSYHRVFLGAADTGVCPEAPFLIYTNLACDGNMITFPYLMDKYGIPEFFIDVPYEKTKESVQFVADQLREMNVFIEDYSHKKITQEALKQRILTADETLKNYRKYLHACKTHYIGGTLTHEMYQVFITHMLLGTNQAYQYSRMLLSDILKGEPTGDRTKLLWIHMMPFFSEPMKELFEFSDRAVVQASDIVYDACFSLDAEKPFESMAKRMVYSGFNGSPEQRIKNALDAAEYTGADGCVIFSHWGCKTTIGAAGLIQEELGKKGLETLILDGDGCNPAGNSDGQTKTRLEAFLEMLKEKER